MFVKLGGCEDWAIVGRHVTWILERNTMSTTHSMRLYKRRGLKEDAGEVEMKEVKALV